MEQQNNSNEEKKYNLYTEHIMPEKGKKVKKLAKKTAFVVAMAVVFGLIAGLVMIIVYRTGAGYIKPDEGRQDITLENPAATPLEDTTQTLQNNTEDITVSPEQTTEAEPESESAAGTGETSPEIGRLTDYAASLKAVAAGVNKASVKITVLSSDGSWADYSDKEYGMVVSGDDSGYYILTDYSAVGGYDSITAEFTDGASAQCTLVAGDEVSGMAVVKASRNKSNAVEIARLGNSDAVSAGDIVIAAGNLYGNGSAVGYGIIADAHGYQYGTDCGYGLLLSDIRYETSGYGFICNTSGEIIAVVTTEITSKNNSLLGGYRASGVRTLIENLINGRSRSYFGIKGQPVNSAAEDNYGIPAGLYVSAVEVGSPAYSAGIQTGDIITRIDAKTIENMSDFMDKLNAADSGDIMTVTVKRKSRDSYKEIVFRVTLGVE